MKQGISLMALAQEIEQQQRAKRDYLAASDAVRLWIDTDRDTMGLRIGDMTVDHVTDLAHRQLGEYVGVPAKYYDRMLHAAPALLESNVNYWLSHSNDKRMIRTLGPKARAFLSDRYRPLENTDLAEAVLPVIANLGVEVLSCQLTETRMYIKAVDKRIEKDVPTGRKMGDGSHTFFDTVSPAIIISNSEVGLGALSIEVGVWTKVCTNLAIAASRSMKKYHIGGKHEMGEEVYALLSNRTKAITDAALWAQVRDVVQAAFDQARFDALTDELAGTAEQKIEGDPVRVVELTAKQFGLGEGEQKSVLRHLIEGGDLTRYGLISAVTRTAEDLDDYDRATEFEKLGGKLIELPANDWRTLAEAA